MNPNLFVSKLLYFIVLSLVIFFSCQSPKNSKPLANKTTQIRDYAGVWTGTLEISQMGKNWQNLAMTLSIRPLQDSTIDWLIDYAGKDKRPYVLKMGPKGPSHWIMDERNGIYLDCFLNGNTLGSMFEVQGSVLICDYTFGQDQIDFVIRASNTKDFTTSGNKINGRDTVPLTHSYVFPMYQHAVLKRKK